MNVERLLEFIDEILGLENQYTVQRKLTNLDDAIGNVVNNPQDPDQQTSVRERLSELKQGLDTVNTDMTPAAWDYLTEAGYTWAFSPELAEKIEREMNNNAMTPAVVKQMVEKRVSERQSFLELITRASETLKALKFKPVDLEPGEAQLGFTIPRDLFHNNIAELSVELKQIDRAVGFFYEAVTGEREHLTLEQFSTTDPLILVGACAPVVLAVGSAIKYLLEQWKTVEEIRELRAKTKAAVAASDDQLKLFDDRLKQVVDEAIAARVKELVPAPKTERENEVAVGVAWALRYLMSRIERGMKVEVKFLPPPAPPQQEVAEGETTAAATEPDQNAKMYAELAEVRNDLLFNEITKIVEPLLNLEAPLPPQKGEDATKSPPRKPRKRREPKRPKEPS